MEKKKSDRKGPISLVTGACGFMGTHMVEILHAAGHTVRATDLASAYEADDREKGRFPSVLKNLGVEFAPSDMARPETLAELVKGVDYIFHIAAVFSYTAPWSVLETVNVRGSRAFYEMASQEKSLKKFILWGAGGVYGSPKEGREVFTEDLAPIPGNNYLISKWQQEYDLMEYGRKGKLKYAIIRPTTVYGPRAVYGGGQMLMEPAKMKTAAVPGNLTGGIPFIHVHDVCGAALFLAENDNCVNEIYNTNDDTIIDMVEFMQVVAEHMGHKFMKLPPIPVTPVRNILTGVATILEKVAEVTGIKPPLEKDSAAYFGHDFRYSNDKLKEAGYVFKYPDARVGIRDTLDWYVNERWL